MAMIKMKTKEYDNIQDLVIPIYNIKSHVISLKTSHTILVASIILVVRLL